uniref:Uncharacterized protein n=1 Tax=Panagrolaimus superbus TaxID=310955 RepID=A0A914ZEJ5_9BILA
MWRQEANGFTRYYVTPLCILDLSSLSCSKETFTQSRKIAFHFNVKLWDHDIATVVQKHLRQKHIEAELGDIFILPMQSVRYGQKGKIIKVKPDYAWRPYGDVPFEMTFKMYALGPQICKNLIDLIKKDAKSFIDQFRPYFEYTLVASTTTSRHIKITGNFLQKSSFYSNLTNHNPDKNGIVYMTSEDANKLAHDVFNSATFDEEVSKGYQASDQEGSIIKELLKNFETDKIQSIKLSKENWDSVFWDNIFTRPDVQTSFLNEVATVDGHKKRVKLDDKKAKAFVKKLANKNSKGHDDSANVGAMFAGVGLEVGRGHGETNSDTNVNEDSGYA